MSTGVELEKGLTDLGVPEHSRDWVRKALHPAGAARTGVSIPDWSLATTARPEYTIEKIVSKPPGVSDTWDCAIYTFPGDSTSVVWETAPAGYDFSARGTPTLPPGGQGGVLQHQPAVYLSEVEMVSVGYGSEPFTPPIFPTSSVIVPGVSCYTSQFKPLQWRHTNKSLTVYMTASSLNDQGTVTSGLFPGMPDSTKQGIVAYRATLPSVTKVVATPCIFTLPMREEDMLVMNPRCRVSAAREGVYIPHQWTREGMPFVEPESFQYAIDQTNSNATYTATLTGRTPRGAIWAVRSRLTGSLQLSAPLVAGDVPVDPNIGQGVVLDSSYDSMMCSVTIFRGLSPEASLTLKSVAGFEVACAPDSAIKQFMQPPGLPSLDALRAYAAICAVSPQVYASKANVFGAILPLLGKAAAFAAPLLTPLLHRGVDWLAGRLTGKPPGVLPPTEPPRPVQPVLPTRPRSRRSASRTSMRSRASSAGSKRSVRVVKPRKRK